mgnify:CR=1 FL=1
MSVFFGAITVFNIRKGSEISFFFFIVLIFVFIVFMERAQRKIFVQYPKRQIGNKMYGGESSHLPLKINTAGVIPAIFASSLLLFPNTISNFSPESSGFLSSLGFYLSHGKPLYMAFFFGLIISNSFSQKRTNEVFT